MARKIGTRNRIEKPRAVKSKGSSYRPILAIVAGAVLGGLAGYFIPDFALAIDFIGQLFLNALKILVVPLIIASIILGTAAMADIGKISRSMGKALLYFLGTGFAAVLIGSILVHIIKPGAYATPTTTATDFGGASSLSINSLLGSILPDSLPSAILQGQFLGLVVFAIFFGIAVVSLGSKGKIIVDLMQAVMGVVTKLIGLLMWVAPLGVFSLVGSAVAGNALSSGGMVTSLAMFSLTVVLGMLLHGLVVLPLILKFFGGRPIVSFFNETVPAMVTAFATSSPAATLPVTYECVSDRNRVDNRACAFVLPLGGMINMNGTAIYLSIAAIFCAQMFQVELSLVQILTVLGAALIMSFGTSMVPNVSFLLLATVMYYAGFPAAAYAGIGAILVVDWFFDRLRMTVNVWGDAVGAAVVSETFDFKTARNVQQQLTSRPQPVARRSGTVRRTDSTRKPTQRQRPVRKEKPDRKESRPKNSGQQRQRQQSRPRKTGERTAGRNRREAAAPKQTGAEKPREFTMPKPPYHVLEQELRVRKDGPVEAPAEKREEVSAGKDSVNSVKVTPPTEKSQSRPTPVETKRKPKAEEKNTASQLELVPDSHDDSSAPPPAASAPPEPKPAAPPPSAPKPATESAPAQSEPEPVAESATEQPPTAYGRSKARRGAGAKSGSAEKKADSDEPKAEEPEFSSENISFGRSKRKK